MRKLLSVTLGILVAALTMPGIGQAQGVAIQGTIQAVDCQTYALVVKGQDGTHVLPADPATAVFVDSAPASFCTLRQYIGRSAAVSLVPRGNQSVAERVDVTVAATSGQAQPQAALISGMPQWGAIALGAVLVGGLLFWGIHGAHKANQSQPYHQCSDGSWGQWCP